MPTRKQRRRREKEKRHDYEVVYMDADGNEIPPEEVAEDTAGAARGGKKQPARPARGGKVPQPASWRRAARRAFIFGPIMFIAIWLLESKAAPGARITVAAFYTVAFIPLFYLMDRLAYRTYHRRLARDAERRKT